MNHTDRDYLSDNKARNKSSNLNSPSTCKDELHRMLHDACQINFSHKPGRKVLLVLKVVVVAASLLRYECSALQMSTASPDGANSVSQGYELSTPFESLLISSVG